MNIFLAVLTYFGYIFVTAMYTKRAVKFLRLPRHLRWELYAGMMNRICGAVTWKES
ncbi:MAG: hypothetical protein ABSC55_07625 [Syntrophorhabdales bacterium]